MPALILFNLFFGRVFFPARLWLVIELVLIAVFVIQAIILSKKILSFVSGNPRRTEAIDAEGKIIQDTPHLSKPSQS